MCLSKCLFVGDTFASSALNRTFRRHKLLKRHGFIKVFIARNMDNGDAWEWIDEPQYPLKFGLAAYRLGMNVIVYAMTH